MNNQIRVSANGTGKVGVIGLCQPVMAIGLDLVRGAFEALEKSELESVLLGQAANLCQEPLDLDAIRQVAGLQAVAEGEFAEFLEPFGIGVGVDTVDRWEEPVLDLAGDDFVRREHEFLDELVGDIVLDLLEPDGMALVIQPDLDLRKIEIERAGLETVLPQKRGQFPCGMQLLDDFRAQ